MFLPVSKKDLEERNIKEVDFVFVSGDAYVDHPSFAVAIISRVLEAFGYTIAILPQPRWDIDIDFKRFGRPKLGFLVCSGNIDSIVNHYTVAKKPRDKDLYSEDGALGKRPDYAVKIYSRIIRHLYPNIPIILGGVEASLRRLCHYDYYKDQLMKSVLVESGADIIIYGMGEKSIVEIADGLKSGLSIKDIIYVRGTTYITKDKSYIPDDAIYLPSYKEVKESKLEFAKSFKIQYDNTDPIASKPLVEEYDEGFVVQNTPTLPFEQEYLDWVYALPYERTYHPMYKKGIPAISEVKFSITSNRGCMGSCSFCSLAFHQGRIIQSRSEESIINEAKEMTKDKDFKGYINDIGGPTANFYIQACEKQKKYGVCKNRKCLYPNKCRNLIVDHSAYLRILRNVRTLDGVKKVFIRSGIRYDYLIYDKNEEFFEELVKYHISGQLRVAPEHISDKVLSYMQKPTKEVYEKFVNKFNEINKKYNKDQYVVPYLMSSHPGCDLEQAIELAIYLKKNHIHVDQVQDFYPTPGTLSTCMYYTNIDPRTDKMEYVYVCKNPHEKKMQRALIQFYKAENYDIVKEALIKANRYDLIGNGPDALIPANKPVNYYNKKKNKK